MVDIILSGEAKEEAKRRKKDILPKSIKQEEFINLMKAAKKKDIQARAAFLLGFGSGMRISEARNLQPNNIDVNAKKILIVSGKGQKDRVVPLPKGFQERHFKALPIKKTVRALQRNFKVYGKKAGIRSELVFHSLRHGFATRLLELGVPINQVQLLLGHSNIATTSIYLKADPRDALKSYEEVF